MTPGSPHPTQCSVHLLAAHPAPIYTPTVWSAARRGLQSSRGLGSSTLLLKAWLSQDPSTSADRPGPQEWAGDPAWGNKSKMCWGSCEPINRPYSSEKVTGLLILTLDTGSHAGPRGTEMWSPEPPPPPCHLSRADTHWKAKPSESQLNGAGALPKARPKPTRPPGCAMA